MRSLLNTFLFLALVAALVSAAPGRIQKRSFKVARSPNANFKGRNGPRELMKAYRKYSMPLPPALLEAIQRQNTASAAEETQSRARARRHRGKGRPITDEGGCTTGDNSIVDDNGTGNGTGNGSAGVGLVTATPESGDVEYLSPVTIGGQTLNLDFDTGSSDLWVFSTQLGETSTHGHTVFDTQKSTTHKVLKGARFSISYGDGSGAAGNVITDTVTIGGVSVENQAVELATAVSRSFVEDTANNGLVGLAFSQLNTVTPQQQKTFFENVLPSLAEPVFTADLRKDAVGAYEFGRIDQDKFVGDITWIPVNTTQGFWQFSTKSFAVGNNKTQAAPPAQAIADTGTTLLLTSAEVAKNYYSQVRGARNDAQAGGITFPCDAELPDLMLDVGGLYMARVKGSDINFAKVQGNTCFGGVQPTTSDLQIWGDVFFKSQFVAFNAGNNTLGMAEHI
ncbi:penicillopepsin [Phialemonium atrogriseum]|uniref:Penicillopepsin n=1 Tax=Phialemonium atrogriseum TaxID=1093897 RepID=A0AAJ0FM71_9PEZI|nr:penicillopepsin [Phialemonium atrogriseum]KAK1765840.1 penicillopepsin [Phialemonium atrogriseum]